MKKYSYARENFHCSGVGTDDYYSAEVLLDGLEVSSIKSAYPSDYQKTEVRHITRNDQGRLKGHYLVGLEILEG